MLFHTAHVLFKVSFGDEPRERQLLEAGDGAAVKAELVPPCGQQGARQDHIADAERRGDGLGEGVHVDKPAGGVHALHGGNGTAGESKFGVVVVFDRVAVGSGGEPTHECLPPADGRHDPGGIVVRGRQMHDRGAAFLERVGAQPLAVHGDGRDGHAVGLIDARDLAVAELFERVEPAASQKLQDEVVEVFRARADEDLLRQHLHPALAQQPLRNRLLQRGQTGIRHRLQEILVFVEDHAAHELGPDGEREQLRRRTVRRCGQLRFRARHGRRCRNGRRERDRFDEVAGAFARGDIALGQQLAVSGFDGDLADVQMLRERALGGQFFSARQAAGEDVGFHCRIELFIERLARRVGESIGTDHFLALSFNIILAI